MKVYDGIREGSAILAARRAKLESDELMESVRQRADIVRRGFDPMNLLSERSVKGGENAPLHTTGLCRMSRGRSLRRCA
jgi:hypothetical protein